MRKNGREEDMKKTEECVSRGSEVLVENILLERAGNVDFLDCCKHHHMGDPLLNSILYLEDDLMRKSCVLDC